MAHFYPFHQLGPLGRVGLRVNNNNNNNKRFNKAAIGNFTVIAHRQVNQLSGKSISRHYNMLIPASHTIEQD